MYADRSGIDLIACFTDFGPTGPYQGQMLAVLATQAPQIPCITLMSDAPMFDPYAAGVLLSRLCHDIPANTLVLAVVDPGVGGGRRPLMIKTDQALFVGPDNGLFVPVIHGGCHACEVEIIEWWPERLSESFHGRDLFAPVAAKLANGETVTGTSLEPCEMVGFDLPADGKRVIYIDHYGNAMTDIPGEDVANNTMIKVNGTVLQYARTFSEVAAGQAFWYRNAMGLVEFAVNRNSASHHLNLKTGMPIAIEEAHKD